jgi:hypothetical protein
MDIKYIIFDVYELNLIDYNQIVETSSETLRYSIDGTKTFIKWIGQEPLFISDLTTKSTIYNNQDMMTILHTDEWEHKLN